MSSTDVNYLATCNETVVFERGSDLIVAYRPSRGSPTLLFVLGLVSFILIANGFVQSFTLGPAIGAAFIGVGVLVGVALWLVVARRRRASDAPPEPVLVLDRRDGVLRNAAGGALAQLAQVTFQRQMQMTSSAAALACVWPGGSVVIAYGNPFGEKVDDLEWVLTQGKPRG
ncbi:MAG: hypothetical protein U0271_45465 [Polyangiaceae bacterium]